MYAAMNIAPKLPLSEPAAQPLAPTREVEFAEMPVKQILNRCTSPAMPFRWTINPYRGCEFGCVYCYARYTHEFLELRDPMDFERRIFVKRGAAAVLARTLARTPLGSDQIALGTATDPYQPAERTYGLTRAMLQVFAQMGGLNLSITTKSALIARDLELLQEINQRSRLSVNFSLITMNRRLQRVLEPRAPRPALRLRALAQLSAGGIRCHLLMMPMIPGITDDAAAVESVIAAARRAGACGVWWRTLFLKPAAARRFLPFASVNFPAQRGRLAGFYANSAYAPRAYDDELRSLFDRLKRKYGFDPEASRENRPLAPAAPAAVPRPVQLSFITR
ncbi:MAG: radical SAM protein [Candidatus Binataceae bacterium]